MRLVVISPTQVVVYDGRDAIAVFEVIDILTKEDIEEIRVADYD